MKKRAQTCRWKDQETSKVLKRTKERIKLTGTMLNKYMWERRAIKLASKVREER